jgi:hypothetical protein
LATVGGTEEHQTDKPVTWIGVVTNHIQDANQTGGFREDSEDKLVIRASPFWALDKERYTSRRSGRQTGDQLAVIRAGFEQCLHKGFVAGLEKPDLAPWKGERRFSRGAH